MIKRSSAKYRLVGATMLLIVIGVCTHTFGQRILSSRISPSTGGKPPALVAADDELASYLTGARKNIKDGNYDRAIEVLQALIEKADSGFVSDATGRRYVALWHRANEALAAMGPDGLELYRRLYNPQAEKLFQLACDKQDTAALRRVTQQFLHTAYGYKALCRLGDIHFDRGGFARSAMYWRRALRLKDAEGDAAMLLAKIASSLHLDGDATGSRTATTELARKHKGAVGVMGGRNQDLAKFVDSIRKIPIPDIAQRSRQAGKEWGGLGSFPDGMALMGESDVVLAPSWRVPGDVPLGPVDIRSKMIAMRSLLTSYGSGYTMTPKPVKGHVYVTNSRTNRGSYRTSSGQSSGFFMPAGIQPVVAGDLVLCRLDDGVAAYNISSGPGPDGEPLWRTHASQMNAKASSSTPRYYSGTARQISDNGRYAMTVDGDMLYLLAKFAPKQVSRRTGRFVAASKSDTSVLQALSIRQGGRMMWQSNYEGLNSDEAVLRGKFISVPTVSNGRLYSVVAFREMYHLVCLAGDTGKMIWRVSISQIPAMGQNYQRYNQHLLERGSPVAIAEGMAFVTTNAGVVAAFEAESGAAVWAYQYDSDVNKAMSRYGSVIQITDQPSVNPIIVTRGRVIALPVDSKNLLILSAIDGKPVGSAPQRRGHSDLSAIDSDRVLLSGPGLMVLSTETGRELHRTPGIGIVGRPAISSGAVLASGQGRIVRLDLKDYSRSTRVFTNSDCLLGNLLCVDGKLIASNTAGVCVYLSYADSIAALGKRIERRKGSARTRLIFDRGQLSFNSGRFNSALADFKTIAASASRNGSTALQAQLAHWLYRTHVAIGNNAKTPDLMQKHFELARTAAETLSGDSRDQYVLRCMMRLAMVMEHRAIEHQAAAAEKLAAGDKPASLRLETKRQEVLADAVKYARKIAETYPEQRVPDVKIGAQADGIVRDTENTMLMLAGVWAQKRFIPRIISDHSRKCYRAYDDQAGDMLSKAIGDNDAEAMLDVAKRWPNSLWAPQAMYEAGTCLYVKTRDAGQAGDDAAMSKAAGLMARAADAGDPMLAATSLAARATIYHDMGMVNYARSVCRDLRVLCRAKGITLSETVEFAGSERSIMEFLRKCEGAKPLRVEPTHAAGNLAGPVNELFALKGQEVLIVRDQAYRPIRQGSNILLLSDGKAVWFNTAAKSAEDAVVWRSGAPVAPMDQIRNYMTSPGYGIIAGISSNGKTVVLADRGTGKATGFEIASGKVAWRGTFAQWGISSVSYMAGADGNIVLTDSAGKVVCVNLDDGKIRWDAKLVGGSRAPVCPPTIAGGVVLVRSNGFKMLTCFNADGGRVLWKWSGGTSAEGTVTDAGLVLALVDGVVSVHDPARMKRPLWTRKYNAGLKPILLTSDTGRVFVSEGIYSPWIDVLSMSDGGSLGRFKIEKCTGAKQTSVVGATARGQSLYVTFGSTVSGDRNRYYGTQSMIRGLGVQKIDLAGGEVVWRNEMGTPTLYHYSLPIAVTDSTVVMACKDTQQNIARHVYLIDAEKGGSIQKIEIYKGPGGVMKQGDRVRVSSMLQPVLVNSSLVLETFGGVSVYRKK